MNIPTLCLNMIVKNESKNIIRLFESVLPIIDCICVCDTGSTDNTKELITIFCTEKNIPCKIVDEEFRNFEYSRNKAFEACRGLSDYVLLMDADMVLRIGNFDKSILSNDNDILILQGNEHFYYPNKRIIKNNDNYNYKGVTHEYINTKVSTTNLLVQKNILFIDDIGDGGCKSNKGERDIQLLEQGIKDEPNNERYYFYLANTYMDTNNNEKSIQMYNKRIELGGWNEEIWNSHYKKGTIYMKMNEPEKAISEWLACYQVIPHRLENIYEIIKYYRIISKQQLCDIFYKLSISILNEKHNMDQSLFLYKDVYDYLIYYEYCIYSYYTNNKNIQKEILVVLNHTDDYNEISLVLRNLKFYPFTLKPIQKKDLSDTIFYKSTHHNIEFNNETFYSSSLSIIPYQGNYLINVRYVNYRYYKVDDKYVYVYGKNDHILTLNKYMIIDKNINEITNEHFLNYINDEEMPTLENKVRVFKGLEDLKIFPFDDKVYFMGSSITKDYKHKIAYGLYQEEEITSTNIKCLFNNSECEKNWVFTNNNGKLQVVYKWYPFTISEIIDNQLHLVKEIKMPKVFHQIRGSTSESIFNNERWFIVHAVSHETNRYYYHMIVVFDMNYELLRYTSLFTFQEKNIEFCLSLIVEEDRVIITNSAMDKSSLINVYDKKYIDSLFISF